MLPEKKNEVRRSEWQVLPLFFFLTVLCVLLAVAFFRIVTASLRVLIAQQLPFSVVIALSPPRPDGASM